MFRSDGIPSFGFARIFVWQTREKAAQKYYHQSKREEGAMSAGIQLALVT